MLGGGFSWFANQYGWTCDSVLEFEIVTPDAKIFQVNSEKNSDLFWALKGSLGAFGILTRIKVPTLRNRGVYGGGIAYEQDAAPALFAALEKLNREADSDPKTQGYISFAWLEQQEKYVYSAYLLNTDGKSDGVAFEDFSMIPHTHNGLNNMTLGKSAEEINDSNPLGYRRCKFTITVRNSAEVMESLHTIFRNTVSDMREGYGFDATGILAMTFQPLTVPHMNAGDNIFKFSPQEGAPTDDEPLIMVSAEVWWTDAEKDAYLQQQLYYIWDSFVFSMAWIEALHPFVYPNYAAKWQKPFEYLANKTLERLASVRKEHDPEDVWQRLVPGIFHI